MNLSILLAAIAMVESGNNDRAVGKAHEISRYQIKPQIWQQYGLLRKQDYTNPFVAEQIALKHARHLQHVMPSFAANSVTHMAAAWNYGPTNMRIAGYQLTNLPPSVISYSERVQNVYERLTESVQRSPVPTLGDYDCDGSQHCASTVDAISET